MHKADNNEVLRQGAEYEETESAAPQNAKIKKDKKPFLIIGGVVAAVILVAIALPKQRANDAENSQVTFPTATQEVEIFFRYTPEELDKLRSYGYTANEIEAGEREFISADVLAEKAREKQESVQREIMAKVNDASSPEYRKLLESTWLGEQPVVFPKLENIYDYTSEERRENVDFVKLPPTGKQLLLRLTLDDGTHIFMAVKPDRWAALKDAGNIVVDLITANYGGKEFITEVKEYEVAK